MGLRARWCSFYVDEGGIRVKREEGRRKREEGRIIPLMGEGLLL